MRVSASHKTPRVAGLMVASCLRVTMVVAFEGLTSSLALSGDEIEAILLSGM